MINAANEVAVERFCRRELSFPGITRLVARVMQAHDTVRQPTLNEILRADAWARTTATADRGD